MLAIGEAYGEAVSDARLEIYFAALADLPLSHLRQAATVHVRGSRFFPRVCELREALEGPPEERAGTCVERVAATRAPRRVLAHADMGRSGDGGCRQ
jgi:hypothetical protein